LSQCFGIGSGLRIGLDHALDRVIERANSDTSLEMITANILVSVGFIFDVCDTSEIPQRAKFPVVSRTSSSVLS
jgi:hypothetical protein